MVGDKIRALRQTLETYSVPSDCCSFARTDLFQYMSFFPAGLGVHDPFRTSISTIVLGTDWGNENSFKKNVHSSKRVANSTEFFADKLLKEAGFDVNDCFFSNAWPVMRAGDMEEQGHHPMRNNRDFTRSCQEFLRETIEILSPKLVMSLGNPCAWFLGPFFGDDWKPGQIESPEDIRIKDLNDEPYCVRNGVVFVTATHPSHLNNRIHRNFKNFKNERDLLVYARRKADIPDVQGWTLKSI